MNKTDTDTRDTRHATHSGHSDDDDDDARPNRQPRQPTVVAFTHERARARAQSQFAEVLSVTASRVTVSARYSSFQEKEQSHTHKQSNRSRRT